MITLRPDEPPHVFTKDTWWLFLFFLTPLFIPLTESFIEKAGLFVFPFGATLMFYLRARDIAWFKKTLSLASLTNAVEDTVFFVAKSGEGFHADVVRIEEGCDASRKIYTAEELSKFCYLLNALQTGTTELNPGVISIGDYLVFGKKRKNQYDLSGTAVQTISADDAKNLSQKLSNILAEESH